MNALFCQKRTPSLRKFSPYVLLALLPGGLIIALVLWLTRRRKKEA